MKVGIDGRVLQDKYYSGVSYYAHHLISALLKRNKHSYFLFYNSFKPLKESLLSLAPYRRHPWPSKIFNYCWQLFFSQPQLDKYLGGVDVFLAPHINFISWSSKGKKIIVVHDLSFLRQKDFFSWRKNFWHRLLKLPKLLKQADIIVTVSQSTKRDLIELFSIPLEKIKVIYSGISAPEIDEKRISVVREKYQLPEKYLLYLGNIEPRKNILNLIKAFEIFKNKAEGQDYKLVLGGAWAWRTGKIKKAWQKSFYKKDIIFTGYIPPEDKGIFYSQAKIFLYPSFYEGFGFPPLEAMACGVPVISAGVSSLPEVLSSAALYADPFSPSSIATLISELITDQKLYENQRALGLKRVPEFNWEKTAQEYEKIFT